MAFLAVAATAVMVALATDVAQAHDARDCKSPYEYYVDDDPPGSYLLWMSTIHTHINDPDGPDGLDSLLDVSAGDGVIPESISIAPYDPTTFDYRGHVVTVGDGVDIYKVYYTTTDPGTRRSQGRPQGMFL